MTGMNTLRRLGCGMAILALASCVPATGPGNSSCSFRGGDALGVFRPGAATVAVADDVLLHRLLQADAAGRAEHFVPAFEPVAPFLRRADLTVVNLEGPAARNVLPGGRDAGADPYSRFDNRIYAGYPAFNFHPTITEALRMIGVDLVQTANNHSLDRGPLGVERTLEALAAQGLPHTGTVPRGQSGPWHHVVSLPISGGRARVAFLACTYSVNGLPDPYRQALRCYGNAPAVPDLIAQLVAQPDIDSVVLLPHWGAEYTPVPNSRQRRLARAAIEAGASAVIGTHPHVLQPVEQITASDGRTGFVAYSLGNFISGQWSLPRRTGAILYFDMVRDAQRRVIALPPRALPTRVERYEGRGVTVSPASFTANGGASIAHARRILGAELLLSPSDLGFANDGSGCAR